MDGRPEPDPFPGLVISMIDTDPSRWRRSLRPSSTGATPALLAVLVGAVAVLSGCGSSSSPQLSTAHGRTMTVVRPSSHAGTSHADVATPKHRSATPARPSFKPTAVAIVKHPVAERSAPDGGGHVLGTITTHTEFGSVTAVPVVRRSGTWLGVIAVLAGNERLGWIPVSATSLTAVGWRIYVSIDRQQITVLFANQVVRRMPTSTGVAGATTPTGHFAITDRLRTGVQEGPYGCCVLALSAVQPLHLSDWDGGNRIAIHATDDTGSLGHPASHGCAHVDDADGKWLLAHIPDGTPVVIANARFHRGRGSPT
jgi:lipoprotein-anchoring transpeptidase ErfK/SrfK